METPDPNVPPIERLRAIMAKLRAPEGCPWDREQTHESIKPQLIEEAYEVLEAIDGGRPDDLREELGDLLLHVVFHAQIEAEAGRFTFDDVATAVADKLVRRHPHVFGEVRADTSEEVLRNWDEIKRAEKPERTGPFDGVPRALPALMRAQEVQKKAAKTGFDWPDAAGPLEKVREEAAELEAEVQRAAGSGLAGHELAEELGDLLFAAVNLARHQKLDAEQCLTLAVDKFIRRYGRMTQLLVAEGKDPASTPLAEMDAAWDRAKAEERR
ncbi:MAG: nucleoside triphosphate pyrophosphohydrolase [Verrucomicrobiota bacterium]